MWLFYAHYLFCSWLITPNQQLSDSLIIKSVLSTFIIKGNLINKHGNNNRWGNYFFKTKMKILNKNTVPHQVDNSALSAVFITTHCNSILKNDAKLLHFYHNNIQPASNDNTIVNTVNNAQTSLNTGTAPTGDLSSCQK